MKLNFNRIMPLISDPNYNTYENLIQEINELKCKLDNLDEQSFYFKKGINSNIEKYRKLIAEHNEIKNIINNNNIAYFQSKIIELRADLGKVKINSTLKMMLYGSIKCSIKRHEDFIVIKKKYGYIEDLESTIKKVFEAKKKNQRIGLKNKIASNFTLRKWFRKIALTFDLQELGLKKLVY